MHFFVCESVNCLLLFCCCKISFILKKNYRKNIQCILLHGDLRYTCLRIIPKFRLNSATGKINSFYWIPRSQNNLISAAFFFKHRFICIFIFLSNFIRVYVRRHRILQVINIGVKGEPVLWIKGRFYISIFFFSFQYTIVEITKKGFNPRFSKTLGLGQILKNNLGLSN